jgi:hypothetical protein
MMRKWSVGMGNARAALCVMRLAIAAIFVLSLALPALLPTIFNTLHHPWQRGYILLLLGWLGIPAGQIEWLGNPALAVVLVAPFSKFSRWIAAPLLGICSFTALFFLTSIPDASGDFIIAFGPGYYLWLTSLVLGMVLPFVARLISNKAAVA